MERVPSWPTASNILTHAVERLEQLVASHLEYRGEKGQGASTGRAFVVGPIGSRRDYLTAYRTDGTVYVRAGCYLGTLDEFAREVEEKYGPEAPYGRQYRWAIDLIREWAQVQQPIYDDVWAGWY